MSFLTRPLGRHLLVLHGTALVATILAGADCASAQESAKDSASPHVVIKASPDIRDFIRLDTEGKLSLGGKQVELFSGFDMALSDDRPEAVAGNLILEVRSNTTSMVVRDNRYVARRFMSTGVPISGILAVGDAYAASMVDYKLSAADPKLGRLLIAGRTTGTSQVRTVSDEAVGDEVQARRNSLSVALAGVEKDIVRRINAVLIDNLHVQVKDGTCNISACLRAPPQVRLTGALKWNSPGPGLVPLHVAQPFDLADAAKTTVVFTAMPANDFAAEALRGSALKLLRRKEAIILNDLRIAPVK